jgi:hypothetical protein
VTGSERVRVLIGVTTGPVEVTGLAAIEELIAQSMACLDRTTQQVPISRGYDAFVKAGSGVVQRLYGHGRFRLDVSAPIDVGESWQAGVLLAHALADKGRLAGRGGEAGVVAWATGTVHIDDLSVGKVGAVDEKLRASLGALRQARASGLEVVVFLPAANIGDVGLETREALARSGVALSPVDRAADMFAALGLPTGKLAEAQTAPASPTRRWRSIAVAFGALAAVMLVGGLAWTALDPSRRIEAVRRAGELAEQEAGKQADDATDAAKAAWLRGQRALDLLGPAAAADRNTYTEREIQRRAVEGNGFATFQPKAGAQVTTILGNVAVTGDGRQFRPSAFDGVMEAAIPGVQLPAGAPGSSLIGQEPGDRLLKLVYGPKDPYLPLFVGRFTSDGGGGGRYLGALRIDETTLHVAMTTGLGGAPLDWRVGSGLDLPIKLAVGRATLADGVVMTGLIYPAGRQTYGSLRWPDGSIYYGQIRRHLANGCGVKVDGRGKVFASGVYVQGELNDDRMPRNCPSFHGFMKVNG